MMRQPMPAPLRVEKLVLQKLELALPRTAERLRRRSSLREATVALQPSQGQPLKWQRCGSR
jgi:hypothetical protein